MPEDNGVDERIGGPHGGELKEVPNEEHGQATKRTVAPKQLA